MRSALRLLAFVVLAAALVPASAQTRRALLIGVDDYATSATRTFSDLRGPANDVRLVRDVLTERGVTEIDTLLGADATRAGILGAIRGWIAGAAPGDHLVFYFSGHGSTVDTTFAGEVGLETIVPHDVDAGDIVDKELRQLWNAALDRIGPSGTLAIIQDNCHSGSGERGEWIARTASPGRRVILPTGPVGPPPSERGALVLSASQDWQLAREGLIGDEYLGGFTWALAQAIRATPRGAPAGRVFARTRAALASQLPAQRPGLSGPADRPLFGYELAEGGGYGIGVADLDDGEVTLLGGRFMGLNPGAELRRFSAEGEESSPVRLRVVRADGSVRSVAEVIEGDAETVTAGDLFEITKSVADVPPVTFYVPPAARDLAAILAEAEACPSGLCATTPTPGVASALVGGQSLAALGADAPGSSAVYRPLPPPVALRARVLAGLAGREGVAVADRPEGADYWLVGALGADGAPRYRWVRGSVALGGDTLTALPEHAALYALSATASPADTLAAVALTNVASRIARSTEWLRRPSPPTTAFPLQVLGLQRVSGGPVLRPDSTTGVLTIPPSDIPTGEFLCRSRADNPRPDRPDLETYPSECYRFVIGLTEADRDDYANRTAATRAAYRSVYLAIVEPDGTMCLAYPAARCTPGSEVGGGNTVWLRDLDTLRPMLTADGDTVYAVPLTDDQMNVYAYRSAPHGRHTVVLLTTNDPVAEPGRFIQHPIQGDELTVRGGRNDEPAPPPPVPTWGIDLFQFDVVPGASPPDAE